MGKQYVMTGDPKTKRLDKYHMITALTKSCNLSKCRQCYVEGIQKINSPNGAMKAETVKRALKEFASVSEKESKETAIAHFKGGEPLVYPSLEEISMFAAGLGLEVFITTNGLEVAENIGMFDRINDASDGKLRLTLSLNGSKPEIDALLRVEPRYYDATINAAKTLASAGITFDINYVIHEGNVQDLGSMVELTKELGAVQLNTLQLILSGRAATGRLRKADPEQMLETLFDIYNSVDNDTRSILTGSLPYIITEMKEGRCGKECVSGYRGLLYVKPDGRAFPCPDTVDKRFLAGNINSSSVEELMNSDGLRRIRDLEIKPGCKGDILTGGEGAEKLRKVIERERESGQDSLHSEKLVTLCVQKNL